MRSKRCAVQNQGITLKENEKKYLMILSFSPPNFEKENKIYQLMYESRC